MVHVLDIVIILHKCVMDKIILQKFHCVLSKKSFWMVYVLGIIIIFLKSVSEYNDSQNFLKDCVLSNSWIYSKKIINPPQFHQNFRTFPSFHKTAKYIKSIIILSYLDMTFCFDFNFILFLRFLSFLIIFLSFYIFFTLLLSKCWN